MRGSTDITIVRAIVHGINPHIANGVTLSDVCLPITAAHPIAKFLSNHIENGLGDHALRAARFVNPANSFVIGHPRDFVPLSRQLATKLQGLMAKDKRISTGALVLCSFKAKLDGQILANLAVLKLDQGDAFKTATAKDRKGRTYVTLDKIADVMPTTRERLQKCAFIRPLTPRPADYDLLVLDRQQVADEPARFFTQDFLSAELAGDPVVHTQQFFKHAFLGLNSVRSQIALSEYDKLSSAIRVAVSANSINIDDWASNLRAPAVARKAIVAALRTVIPDATIETDAAEAHRLTKTHVIRGDHKLKITFEAAHASDIVESSQRVNDPNKGEYVRLILNVKNYVEEGK
ncbi:MAG: nucleoid-associated protein [Planctomycetes bacterium]|nr:nucleoid-associated protein [Planctomycetota bacterium]